jgi:gliding-associated putative ABC transporter substrate-binding component GldG
MSTAKDSNTTSTDSMDRRKRSYASNATVYAVFIIGGIVLVNLIATRVFGRLDLTQHGVYTLSPSSKDIVRGLPDYLTVKAYISKDLPPELVNVSRYTRDLMDEYRTASKGKLRFEAFDPSTDKQIEEEANACKVAKLQIQVMREQKFEVSQQYLGLCFQYNGQTDSIPQVTQSEGLEYMVSSLMKRMTQHKRKVNFTVGHGEQDTTQGFTFLKHFLEQEFEVGTVNPAISPIPDDVDALVVGGPKQPFDEKGRKEIDSFLMKGKGAIFLVDGMAMNSPQGNMPELQQMQPKIGQANNHGLDELLEKYGFKVGQDFVFDKQNVPGPVDFGGRKMLANLPVFIGVKTPEIADKDFSVVAGIEAMVFPFASSVELVGPLAGGKVPAKGRLWTLATTSKKAWKQTGFFFFTPNTKIEEGKDKGMFSLAYAYQGPLRSAFAPAAPAPAPGMSTPEQPGAPASESKKPVRLVVVGDSDFASDEYLQMSRIVPLYNGGGQMLFNAIGWVIEDEALTPVRLKTVAARPLSVDSDQKATVIKWSNVCGVPVAFILFGLVRWRLRRASRLQQKL